MSDAFITRRGGGSGGGSKKPPEFTYTGDYETILDDNGVDWRIKFKTSGTLTFGKLNSAKNGIDVFMVGGGGAGSGHAYTTSSGGGGGGYTHTEKRVLVQPNVAYPIFVGSGGAAATPSASGGNGTASTAFDITAAGGMAGVRSSNAPRGGNGGSGGGTNGYTGGSDGANGGGARGGVGQGNTTREFGEPTGDLYAGGGAGYSGDSNIQGGGGGGGSSSEAGKTNLGGGGGGGNYSNHGKAGGSGIVIIRNARI